MNSKLPQDSLILANIRIRVQLNAAGEAEAEKEIAFSYQTFLEAES
jgi:hypothetical protein